MISHPFLKAQMSKTRSQKQVTPFLRRFIASVVTRAAAEYYGNDYYKRRLPVNLALTGCLAMVGVQSKVWVGAFCVPEFYPNKQEDGWGGFWGRDFQAWTTTEFGEIVDLNAVVLMQQANARSSGGIPMPPVWWNDIRQQPAIIRYVPDTVVSLSTGGPYDMADAVAFIRAVEHGFFETVAKSSVHSVHFEPFVEDIDSMQRLFDAGHLWFKRAITVEDLKLSLPEWICDREIEIQLAALNGHQAPTRLAGILAK